MPNDDWTSDPKTLAIEAADAPQARTADPQATGPLDTPARADAIIDRWFDDTFPGSVAGRDVQVWNLIHAAKDDLKRRFAQEG